MSTPLSDAELVALAKKVIAARAQYAVVANADSWSALHDAAEDLSDACEATVILSLLERLQRAEKAQERLTWMKVNHASFGTTGMMVGVDGGAPVWRETQFVRVPCRHLYEWHCFDGATVDDAIDSAMDAPPCQSDEVHGCSQSRTIREHGAETPVDRERARADYWQGEYQKLAATLAEEIGA